MLVSVLKVLASRRISQTDPLTGAQVPPLAALSLNISSPGTELTHLELCFYRRIDNDLWSSVQILILSKEMGLIRMSVNIMLLPRFSTHCTVCHSPQPTAPSCSGWDLNRSNKANSHRRGKWWKEFPQEIFLSLPYSAYPAFTVFTTPDAFSGFSLLVKSNQGPSPNIFTSYNISIKQMGQHLLRSTGV